MGTFKSKPCRSDKPVELKNFKKVVVPKAKWERNKNCIWKSVNGTIIRITDLRLNNLTSLEINILQRITYCEIDNFNIDKSITDAVKNVYVGITYPSKNSKYNGKKNCSSIFGRTLDSCLAHDRQQYDELRDHEIPLFVYYSIDYLEKHALHSVGLFRISPSYRRIKEVQMRMRVENNCVEAINQAISPHDIATLLKDFFRELPEPLICKNLYLAFTKSHEIKDTELRLKIMAHLISFLPPVHCSTLWALLKFLARVASFSDDTFDSDGTLHFFGNKMSIKNLAIIFAPNVLRNGSAFIEEKHRTFAGVVNVMVDLIENHEKLFCVKAKVLDSIYARMIETNPLDLNLIFMFRRLEFNEMTEEEDIPDDIKPIKLFRPIELSSQFLMVETKTIYSTDDSTSSRDDSSILKPCDTSKASSSTSGYISKASTSTSGEAHFSGHYQ